MFYGNTLSQVEKIKDSTGKIIDVTTNYLYNLRNELNSISISDGKNTSVTKNYYDIDGQRVRKVEDDVETNYMYVGSSILYTTDNNANKATENILDPSGGIVGTKRFDGKYEMLYVTLFWSDFQQLRQIKISLGILDIGATLYYENKNKIYKSKAESYWDSTAILQPSSIGRVRPYYPSPWTTH